MQEVRSNREEGIGSKGFLVGVARSRTPTAGVGEIDRKEKEDRGSKAKEVERRVDGK